MLSGIMKGHPELIKKSECIFGLLFSLEMVGETELELLWSGIRKGDIETRQAILTILNESYYDLSLGNMKYFIENMITVAPKHLAIEEVEFAARLCKFLPTEAREENITLFTDLSNKIAIMLWKISSSNEIVDPIMIKKCTDKLIELIQDVPVISV